MVTNRRIFVTIAPPADGTVKIARYRVRYRKTGEVLWNFVDVLPENMTAVLPEIEQGNTYEIQAQSISIYGVESAWTTAYSHEVTEQTADPEISASDGNLHWDDSANPAILKVYSATPGWVDILSVNTTTGVVRLIGGVVDEDDMASNSDVLVPTQQSVKAYVDSGASASVAKSDYNAYTILAADTDNTPLPLTVPASTVVGRKDTGGIVSLTMADLQALLNGAAYNPATVPAHYERDIMWVVKTPYTTAANRYTLVSPNRLTVNINNGGYILTTQEEKDLSASASWDTTSGTDYTVAANRAGKDFYIYACDQSTIAPKIVLSANSTVPSGYTSSNSRKIGGFHCLCASVGTISGHTLTDFVAGDILPASVWDLRHRASCDNAGMVYDAKSNIWVDIYLASGTGSSTASVNGGTISDTRSWLDFVDDGGAVGKRLLRDREFQLAAAGSNEGTNITGSADPVTTGGHSDTAGRRMISDIGCEDMCGAMYQWLDEQSYRFDDAASHTHTENTASSYTQNATTGSPSGDVAPAWGWITLPGSKGNLYSQGTYGDAKLVAGGSWTGSSNAGSRCRYIIYYRTIVRSAIGARFSADPA